MLALDQVQPSEAPGAEEYGDCTIYQTDQWLDFVEETQAAERVVAVVRDGNTTVGRFTGLVVRKLGRLILGSPLPGWTTSYMGFNLDQGVPRTEAMAALDKFVFKQLGCIHYECMDRRIAIEQAEEYGYRYRVLRGFEIDLSQTEDALFAAMHSNIRNAVRKSQRRGVTIEEATDPFFADEYYTQLIEVFKRQGLKPTYDNGRVPALMRHLLPTGRLLLLRARDPDGQCASTLITLGFNGCVYAWGGSSQRNRNVPHSIEAITWHAMRYWKARGMTTFDHGGWGEYKRRYGGCEIGIPWIRRSKYPGLEFLRENVRRSFAIHQQMRNKVTLRRNIPGSGYPDSH